MLFRLTNTLAMCQALINNVLQTHPNITIVAYLNNILVCSKTLEEHKVYIGQVSKYLAKANLRLTLAKCKQHKEEVKFLSFIIGRHRVKISKKKVKVIKSQKTLILVKGIQKFLGFINFDCCFIKNHSFIALLLIKFTQKDILLLDIRGHQNYQLERAIVRLELYRQA